MTSKKRISTEKDKSEEEGRAKKRMRTGSSPATRQLTPVARRSSERKPVGGFLSTPSSSKAQPAASKTPSSQGSGTKLEDIPSVSLKLVKHKIDEKLQVLHTILHGKSAKAYTLKGNILQFSGFIWGEKEAKLRVKKALDKFNKEILLYFCEILDIGHVKTSTKKEEITAKIADFLESPCITIDVIPTVKEAKQREKIKKMLDKCNNEILLDFCEILGIEYGKTSKEKDEISAKLIKILESRVTADVMPEAKKCQRSPKQLVLDGDENEDISDSDDPHETSIEHKYERNCESEQEEEDSDEGEPGETVKRSKGKQTEEIVQSSKIKKNVSPAKGNEDLNNGPSTSDLHAAISKIMGQMHLNTITLSDIVSQLGGHFNVDLTERREEVKELVEDVIHSMFADKGDKDDVDDVEMGSAKKENSDV